jgi:hypothetical protein
VQCSLSHFLERVWQVFEQIRGYHGFLARMLTRNVSGKPMQKNRTPNRFFHPLWELANRPGNHPRQYVPRTTRCHPWIPGRHHPYFPVRIRDQSAVSL